MKKIFLLFMLFASFFTLSSCLGGNEQTSTGDNVTEDGGNVEKPENSVGFAIHYQRKDSNYAKWGLWLWPKGGEGDLYEFNGEDSYGAYYKSTWEEFGVSGLESNQLGFIVRELSQWNKDVDSDRFIDFSTLDYDSNGYYNVYLKSGVIGMKTGTIK